MVTFISILFILIAINATLLVFSVNGSGAKKTKEPSKNIAGSAAKIYPLDLTTSKYKKAV